eukprot:13464164-Ditylum_brightwellii.AAC.1
MELEDPKKAQQWRTVDLPEEILHYHTAANSPVSEIVFKDEFNSEELDEVQQLSIQHYKLEPVDKVISTKTTKAQWKGKVAKQRENTTTSSLGRHVGHFKALLRKLAESLGIDEG